MKILYLAFVRLPTERAHGLQIMKTCEAFAHAGAKVELVIPGRATAIAVDPFSYYAVKKSFALTSLATPDLVRWGRAGFIFSLFWFAEVAKWRKVFWRADIIYSRDALVLLQYRLLGRKLVFEAHRKPTLVDRVVARRAYRVIAITESLKRVFIAAGVPEAKIVVAHDAVDAAPVKKRSRAELGLPEGALAVYAGSLSPEKGVETLREAIPLLSGVTVMLVTGKTPSEVREILAAADVVVVPNSARVVASSTYTSPMKLFEALGSGAEVVVSDVPAIREIAGSGAVWYFAPDDPASLAKAVKAALAGPARVRMSAYTWDERAAAILASL